MGSLSLRQRLADGSLDPDALTVAHFPAQSYCDPPHNRSSYTSRLYLAPDQEFRGISLQGQLARLNRLSPVSAHPLDESSQGPLSLTFASTDDHLCLELEAHYCYDTLATVAGTVRVNTEDGVVDGELPVSYIVSIGKELPRIYVNSYRSVDLDRAAALLERSGIHAKMQYTDQIGVAAQFSAWLAGENLRGTLRVVGTSPCAYGPDPSQCGSERTLWSLDWWGPGQPQEENLWGQ